MLHFFSVGDSAEKAPYLFESAKLFNVPLKFLEAQPWTGYYDKIRCMKNAIKDLPPTDLICFMDAYDVIITADPDEIVAKFKEFGADLVFSAELNCWPEKYKTYYPHTTTRFLNSGTYMGTQAALMELFNWKTDEEIQAICAEYTDQGYVHEYYAAHPEKIVLDTQSRLFQCMYFIWWKEFLITFGRPYNTIMEQTPCIMHFNGHSWRARALNVMPIFLERIRITKERDCIMAMGDVRQYMYAETHIIPKQK
jgi:hypothetical protein